MRVFTSRPWKHLVFAAALSMFSAAGGCKQSDWPLWDAYKARFVDVQGRVFDPHGDQHTTSEGQAYALFFALVDNDRAEFDRVLKWTQANLAEGDLRSHLCAWEWGKAQDGVWKPLDAHSAADADVWLAYTLLEAGRLWGDAAYAALGRAQLALIAKSEVADLPGFGQMLLPGPEGFQHDKDWTLNPSYLPLFLFERLAHADPTGPWRAIALNIPRLLEGSARHGFAMDWIEYVPGDGFYPAAQNPGETGSPEDQGGSYDAIRVYLWAGMIGAARTRQQVLNAVAGMSGYLASHNFPPERVNRNGVPQANDGPVGFSAALLPYLRALGVSKSTARQMVRMNAERSAANGLYGKDLAYYDQNLALFGTGFLDDRFEFGPEGELNVGWKRA